MKFLDTLPPEAARRWREWTARGGRNGSREAKIRAGQASARARKAKKEQEQAAKLSA